MTVCSFFSVVTIGQTLTSEGYQLSQIAPEPYTQVVKRSGKVSFKHTVNLSFKTVGFLTSLKVDEGETFKKGQVLAALDTEELIAEKNASYARLLQAKRNVNRIKALLAKKLSSQRELDDALTALDTTRSAYRVAFYNAEKAQILAPFDGIVVTRNTNLGELQSPNKIALEVAALTNNLIISVALTGEEISLVHLDQKVAVALPHLGELEGNISKIPAMADAHSHLFNIEVILPATITTRPLVVGQLGQIMIYSPSEQNVYRLPIEALNSVDKQGRALIAVEENNKPILQAHQVFKIDNQYLYLQANKNSPTLSVITQGWNKLSLISKEP